MLSSYHILACAACVPLMYAVVAAPLLVAATSCMEEELKRRDTFNYASYAKFAFSF